MKKILKNVKHMDRPLLIVTIIFFIFGLFNIVNASARESLEVYGGIYNYFFRHLIMLIIGFVATLFIINVDSKKYPLYMIVAFIFTNVCLIYLLIYGEATRGAINWVDIMGVRFQPSELAKPVIIVGLALIFDIFQKKLRDKDFNKTSILASIIVIGLLSPAIVFLQKDFGTMFILLAIFGVMFLASPILPKDKFRTIGVLLILVILFFGAMYVKNGYILSPAQMERFNYQKPCDNYTQGGYQICNGFIAINEGGLWGVGIGKSRQKYSYIPEPHTDSIFAIVLEEMGLIKTIPIFLAFIFVLYRILYISSRSTTVRGKYIAFGTAIYIFLHIFVNLGGLFGLIPLTGVPLPFLSYGGTFTVSLIVALAFTQRVSIETSLSKVEVKSKKKVKPSKK